MLGHQLSARVLDGLGVFGDKSSCGCMNQENSSTYEQSLGGSPSQDL